MSEDTARLVSIGSIALTVVALLLTLWAARRPAPIRPGADAFRIAVSIGGLVVMGVLVGAGTSPALAAGATLAGVLFGVVQGRHLRVERAGSRLLATRSGWSLCAWGAGIVVVQAAALASRTGAARFGIAVGCFGVAMAVGVVLGRARPVRSARRLVAAGTAGGALALVLALPIALAMVSAASAEVLGSRPAGVNCTLDRLNDPRCDPNARPLPETSPTTARAGSSSSSSSGDSGSSGSSGSSVPSDDFGGISPDCASDPSCAPGGSDPGDHDEIAPADAAGAAAGGAVAAVAVGIATAVETGAGMAGGSGNGGARRREDGDPDGDGTGEGDGDAAGLPIGGDGDGSFEPSDRRDLDGDGVANGTYDPDRGAWIETGPGGAVTIGLDTDGDGIHDVIGRDLDDDGLLDTVERTGDGTYTTYDVGHDDGEVSLTRTETTHLVDADGDGRPDSSATVTGDGTVTLDLDGDGVDDVTATADGTLTGHAEGADSTIDPTDPKARSAGEPAATDPPEPTGPSEPSPAGRPARVFEDTDGDGTVDTVTETTDDGTVVRVLDEDGVTAGVILYDDQGGAVAGGLDIDGDGDLDLMVVDTDGDGKTDLMGYDENGDGTVSRGELDPAHTIGGIAAGAADRLDFDGDGQPDFVASPDGATSGPSVLGLVPAGDVVAPDAVAPGTPPVVPEPAAEDVATAASAMPAASGNGAFEPAPDPAPEAPPDPSESTESPTPSTPPAPSVPAATARLVDGAVRDGLISRSDGQALHGFLADPSAPSVEVTPPESGTKLGSLPGGFADVTFDRVVPRADGATAIVKVGGQPVFVQLGVEDGRVTTTFGGPMGDTLGGLVSGALDPINDGITTGGRVPTGISVVGGRIRIDTNVGA